MITNFMYPEDKKKNYFLVIPKSPHIFDKFDIFRLSVCTGCAITLFLYSMYFMASCVSLVCIAIIAFMFSQMTKNIKARMHIDCMKKLKKIYDTPVYQEKDETITYTFVTPSEKFIEKMMKLNKQLKKN